VVDEEDPHEPTPQQPRESPDQSARDRPAQGEWDQEREGDQPEESFGDPPHAAILDELAGEASSVRHPAVLEEPAHVRVPQAREAASVAEVRGVGVALLVGVCVVAAVVGDPIRDRALHGHRAQNGQQILDRLVGGEGAVRQQAVVADRHPARGDDVHAGEDRQVGPAHGLVPEQDEGGDETGEGDHNGRQIDVSLQAAHRL
jgi:hypothetical protein